MQVFFLSLNSRLPLWLRSCRSFCSVMGTYQTHPWGSLMLLGAVLTPRCHTSAPEVLLPPLWDKFHTTLGPVVQILLSSSSSSGNQPHPTTSLVVGHSCLAAAQASPAAFICHKAPGLNHHRREHRELHLNLQTNSTPNNTDMFTLKTEP